MPDDKAIQTKVTPEIGADDDGGAAGGINDPSAGGNGTGPDAEGG